MDAGTGLIFGTLLFCYVAIFYYLAHLETKLDSIIQLIEGDN